MLMLKKTEHALMDGDADALFIEISALRFSIRTLEFCLSN